MPSNGRYEAWITRLKVAWLGKNARAMFGAYGRAMGDRSYDEAEQGVLEHMPQYASDPKSIALIADERQLDTYPFEPVADIAARAPYWLEINKFRGRGLGLLLGLHFAGFDGAVIVQQNGRALSLSLPLPDFSGNWDPTPNLVVQDTSTTGVVLTSSVTPPTVSSAGRSIPAGTPWVGFDSNTDFCSRFAVIFPAPLGQAFLWSQIAAATFSNSDSASVTWDQAVQFASYQTIAGGAIVTDGGAGVNVWVDGTTQTSTGVTIRSSAPFTGTVWASAYPALSVADQARLKATIKKWKPAKATCLGVYACQTVAGVQGWPIRKMGDGTKMGDMAVSRIVAGNF